MTVAELRKALKGIPGKTRVVLADHDHGKYEWNAYAGKAMMLDQKDADPWDGIEKEFEITGPYFVIRP